MNTREESLRGQIALGWITIMVIACMVFVFAIIQSVLTEADDGFSTLRNDPGLHGIRILAFVIGLYVLMPVYVSVVNGLRPRLFRWLAVAFAAVGLLFNIMHHHMHWQSGQKPDLSSHVLDLAVHTVGLWVLVTSVKWARIPRTAVTS